MPSHGSPVVDGQDTLPVVFRKQCGAGPKSHGQRMNSTGSILHKIDKEAHGKIGGLPKARRQLIQRARLGLKMTQKQLAVAASLKPADIQAFESGALAPSPAQVAKLQRVLKRTI